jgi:hypothetical protein
MKTPITLALDALVQELNRRAAAEDRSRSYVANGLLRAALGAAGAVADPESNSDAEHE